MLGIATASFGHIVVVGCFKLCFCLLYPFYGWIELFKIAFISIKFYLSCYSALHIHVFPVSVFVSLSLSLFMLTLSGLVTILLLSLLWKLFSVGDSCCVIYNKCMFL